MRIILLLLLLALTLSACQPRVPAGDSLPDPGKEMGALDVHGSIIYVSRYIDHEAGVACWVSATYNIYGGGISCLPLDQTKLR